MLKKRQNRVFGFVAILATSVFLGLMLYAMTRDPNLVPSQLVGKAAPAAEAKWDNGDHFRSTAVVGRGRWVIMNFWNTSCVVCRYEAPELDRFYRETVLRDSAAPLFVSVNIQDSDQMIENYKRSLNLSFPVVADSSGKMSLDFGVYGTPETFFIDPEGVVRHRVAGEVDGPTILEFIRFLEANPRLTAEQAIEAFARVRAGAS